jgi:hypothetical protein
MHLLPWSPLLALGLLVAFYFFLVRETIVRKGGSSGRIWLTCLSSLLSEVWVEGVERVSDF